MQEQCEAERRAIWPCLNVATSEGSEATEPYNKYNKIRPHSIRSLQFDQKVRPTSILSTKKIRPNYSHPNDVQPLRPELVLMSVKNFRTCVILSSNQILGGFDVDRLCPIFLSSIGRTFLFFRQTQPLLKRFCKRNIFECFRESRREKATRTKS